MRPKVGMNGTTKLLTSSQDICYVRKTFEKAALSAGWVRETIGVPLLALWGYRVSDVTFLHKTVRATMN